MFLPVLTALSGNTSAQHRAMTRRPLTERHRHFPAEGRQSRQKKKSAESWCLSIVFPRPQHSPHWIDVQ